MLDKNEKGALDSCGIETYIEYYRYFWTLDRPSLKEKIYYEHKYTEKSIATKISNGIKLTKTKEIRKRILEHIINHTRKDRETKKKAQELLSFEL